MPVSSKNSDQQSSSDVGWMILAIIILLAAIGLSAGYYFYSKNKPSTPTDFVPEPTYPLPSTPEPTIPTPATTTLPTPETDTSRPTVPTNDYTGWKTYVFRGTATNQGFSIKYPPGYAVGQEYTKDETFFTIYKNPNPLNEEPAMTINYDARGDIRFSLHDKEWAFYDQVVQSFSKQK